MHGSLIEQDLVESIGSSIIKTIPHALIAITKDGKILYANENTKNIFGYIPSQIVGKPFSMFFTPEDLDILNPNLIFFAKNNTRFDGELMLLRRNEARFFAYLYMLPIPTQDICVVCIQDIDNTKKLKQIVNLGHYDDLIKLANGIAHELRNPLTTIGGFIARIQKICELDANNYKYYESVMSGLHKIENLIKKIQGFVMMPRPELRPWKMRDIVEAVFVRFQKDLEKKGIRAECQMGDSQLYVDRQLMEKVFSILIENAIEAIEHDQGQILVTDDQDQGRLKIYFKDNGSGILSSELPYIFNPFFSTKAHGIGIDLATARKIIQAHNGTIEVNSRPGDGTCFVIQLPLERRRKIRLELLEKENPR